MNKKEILIDLQNIFRQVMEDDHLVLSRDNVQGDLPQWDSLRHAALIEEIEKYYNIKFDLMDMLSMQSVGDICDKIISKIH